MKPEYKIIEIMGMPSLQGDYGDKTSIHNIKKIIEKKDLNKESKDKFNWLKKNHPELII